MFAPEPVPGSTVDLAVVLTAAPGTMWSGATVPLTVDVVNNGIVAAPNAEVVVTLPSQFVVGMFDNVTGDRSGAG